MMMSHLIASVLAQVPAGGQGWEWPAATVASLIAIVTLFGRWITQAFSRQLDQHAAQNRERDDRFAEQSKARDDLFAAQMERRDSAQNRMAEAIQELTRTLAVQVLEWSRFDDNGSRPRAKEFAERTIEKIDRDRAGHQP